MKPRDTTLVKHQRLGSPPTWDALLADTSVLEELQEDALNRVLTPMLLLRVGEGGLRGGGPLDRGLECCRIKAEIRAVPGALHSRFVYPVVGEGRPVRGAVPVVIGGRPGRRNADLIVLDFGDDRFVSGKEKEVWLNFVFAHDLYRAAV